MTFTELQAAVTNRLGLISGDQIISTVVASMVNEALHETEMDNVNGWDWLRSRFSSVTVAGNDEYAFSTLVTSQVVTKIIEVRLAVSSTSIFPLQRVSIAEAQELYPIQVEGTPEVWSADGNVIVFTPVPNAVYAFSGTCVLGEPDLSGGTDEPLMPVTYQSLIVEKAVELFATRMQNYPASKAANERYKELRAKAIAHSRPYVGPGRVRASSSWDRSR